MQVHLPEERVRGGLRAQVVRHVDEDSSAALGPGREMRVGTRHVRLAQVVERHPLRPLLGEDLLLHRQEDEGDARAPLRHELDEGVQDALGGGQATVRLRSAPQHREHVSRRELAPQAVLLIGPQRGKTGHLSLIHI